jgi:hypothetical protein
LFFWFSVEAHSPAIICVVQSAHSGSSELIAIDYLSLKLMWRQLLEDQVVGQLPILATKQASMIVVPFVSAGVAAFQL